MNNFKKHFIFSLFVLGMSPFISFAQSTFSINVAGTDAKCNSNANGSATVTVSGVPPYTYSWSPTGGTAAVASNLVAGTYKVLVTDNNGVSILDSITISQPPALSAYIDSIVVAPCFLIGVGGGACGCNNTLWAVVNGGTAPYRYSWTPGGETTDSVFNVCYVEFTVMVTDTNNCTTNASLNVVIPKTVSTAGINSVDASSTLVKVYPNPANNQLTISIPQATNNTRIEIYDMLGNRVIEQKINATLLASVDVSNLVAGNYFLRVIDNNGQKSTRFSINR